MHSLPVQATLLVLLSFLVSGCATTTVQYAGKKVSEDQVLAIENGTGTEQIWKTKDLQLRYTVDSTDAAYLVKGDVTIDSSISYTFPNVDVLNIYGYLLDANGTVLDKRTAEIRYIRLARFADKTAFQLLLPKNEKGVAMAFGYDGVFTNRTARPMRSLDREDRQISFSPFVD